MISLASLGSVACLLDTYVQASRESLLRESIGPPREEARIYLLGPIRASRLLLPDYMGRFLSLLPVLLAATHAAKFTPVHTVVRDRGGVVHVKLIPVEGGGVLHLRMTGKKISRVAAKRSIQSTTAGIHKCPTCTAVVEMGECNGVSPLALRASLRRKRHSAALRSMVASAAVLRCAPRQLLTYMCLDLYVLTCMCLDCLGRVCVCASATTAQFLLSHPTLKHILIIEARGAVLLACRTVKRLSGHDKFDIYQSWADFEAACSKSGAAHRRSALKVAKQYRPASDDLGSCLRAFWSQATQGAEGAAPSWLPTWARGRARRPSGAG